MACGKGVLGFGIEDLIYIDLGRFHATYRCSASSSAIFIGVSR